MLYKICGAAPVTAVCNMKGTIFSIFSGYTSAVSQVKGGRHLYGNGDPLQKFREKFRGTQVCFYNCICNILSGKRYIFYYENA